MRTSCRPATYPSEPVIFSKGPYPWLPHSVSSYSTAELPGIVLLQTSRLFASFESTRACPSPSPVARSGKGCAWAWACRGTPPRAARGWSHRLSIIQVSHHWAISPSDARAASSGGRAALRTQDYITDLSSLLALGIDIETYPFSDLSYKCRVSLCPGSPSPSPAPGSRALAVRCSPFGLLVAGRLLVGSNGGLFTATIPCLECTCTPPQRLRLACRDR